MSRSRVRVQRAFASLALLGLMMLGSGVAQANVREVHLVAQETEGAPFAFSPARIEIAAGTTVRWENDEDVFHTVTSTDSQMRRQPNGVFDEVLDARGKTFEFTFAEPGTFEYYCQPHAAFMFGTVVVTEAEGGGATPGVGALALLAMAGSAALLWNRWKKA